MNSNSIVDILNNISSSCNKKKEKYKNVGGTKVSVHFKKKEELKNIKMNKEELLKKNKSNPLPESVRFKNGTTVEYSSSNVVSSVRAPKVEKEILDNINIENTKRGNISGRINDKISNKISNKIRDKMNDKINDKISNKVNDKNNDKIYNKMNNKNKRRQDRHKEKYLCSLTSPSERYDKNMVSNHYLLSQSCAYLRFKCAREANINLSKIGKNKNIIMDHHIANDNNENSTKYVNKISMHNYPYNIIVKKKRKRDASSKINEEQNVLLGKPNCSMMYSTLYNDTHVSIEDINGMTKCQSEKYMYDLLYEHDNKNRIDSINRTKYDGTSFPEAYEIFEKEKHINSSGVSSSSINNKDSSVNGNNRCRKTISCMHRGETSSQGNKNESNNVFELMKIKFIMDQNERSSYKRDEKFFYSNCNNNNNKFIKFLMTEIKIEIKVYKLILLLLILILVLSFSKSVSNYIVITRKCYNIYENPIKSVKRLLKFMIIALKIGYKFSLPLILYTLSFFSYIITRTFVILNIPIVLLLLYCKFVLKIEEYTIRLYIAFLVNIYKYIVFQFAYIFKKFAKDICLADFLSLIYKSYCFIFICMCKILQKLYDHMNN